MSVQIENSPITEVVGVTARKSGSWTGHFNKMVVGQRFLIATGETYEKDVRNAKASARAFNKTNNAVQIEWRTNDKGTYFGPVKGPGAVTAAVVE